MSSEEQKGLLKKAAIAAIKHTNTQKQGGNIEKTIEEVAQSVLECIEQEIPLNDIKRALKMDALELP